MKKDIKFVQSQAIVDAWNTQWPSGSRVTLVRDLGEKVDTATRSEAWVLASGDAVIQVVGVSGCYLLERVIPHAATAQEPPR